MRRRIFLASLLALAGCSPPDPTKRTLTKSEVEADIANRVGLHDVSLKDQGGGKFTGTAVNAAGKTCQVEVLQEARKYSWKLTLQEANNSHEEAGSIGW